MIYLHLDQTPGLPAFLLWTYVITFLGVVTVSDGVEVHGEVNETPVEDFIDVALVHVCNEHVLWDSVVLCWED